MKIHLKTVDLAGLAGFEPTNTEVKAPDVEPLHHNPKTISYLQFIFLFRGIELGRNRTACIRIQLLISFQIT